MRGLHRGAAVRLAAELTGRGLQLLLIYAAQRILGPALFGQFTFAVAVGLLASVCTDWGTPLIVTREIARRPTDGARIAGAGLAVKLALTLPAIALVVAAAFTRPPEIRLSAIALGLAMLASSFVEFVGYVLRGLQRIHQETVMLFALRILTLAFGGWALWSGQGLVGLSAAYLLAASMVLAASTGWLAHRFFWPVLRFDAFAREVVGSAVPLGGATVVSMAFTRTPIFMLDVLHGPSAVGVYGVAQKLTEPLALIPAALMASTFPALSRRRPPDASGNQMLMHSLKVLAVIGTGVLLAGVLFGPRVIVLLYGDQYPGAGPVLQVLAAAALPVFVNYALTHVLIVRNQPHLNLIFNVAIFSLNLVVCWTLGARFGAAGAATAVLISEVALFGLCWWAIRRTPDLTIRPPSLAAS